MLKRKKLYKTIGILLVAALCLTGCGNKTAPTNTKPKVKHVDNYITASGVLEADNQYNVSTTVMADIVSDNFKEGDTVKAGQLLYALKQKDIQNNIKTSEMAVEQAELAYNQTSDNLSKLSIKSDFAGTVTNVYVQKGDMVQAGGKIADVVEDNQMKLNVPFVTDLAKGIYVGASAKVSIVGTFYTLTGSVTNVSSGNFVLNGSNVKMIEITITNPGTIKKGDKATATINGVACSNAGEFDYTSNGTIISEVAGKVEAKNIKVGDRVYDGTVVVGLSNDAMEQQLQQSTLSIKNAKLALSNLKSQLENYNITAKINGTVIKKNVKKNDAITQVNMGNLATIADLSKIVSKVQVDEMDVTKIKVGSPVTLTADANPNTVYKGTVETVSKLANKVNDVALYEVKIDVVNPGVLVPGMNVTAKFNMN